MAVLQRFFRFRLLNFLRFVVLGGAFTSVTSAKAQTAMDAVVQGFLGQTFAQAALFNDADVVTFGIWDFNPNDVVDLGSSNFGERDSAGLRESIRHFSVPVSWKLSDESVLADFSLLGKFGYLEVDQMLNIVPSNERHLDRIKEQVFSAGIGAAYLKPLDEHWELVLESYISWMRYDSEVDFNTTESRAVAPSLDGLLTNIEVESRMLEPAIGVNYNWSHGVGKYQLFTKQHFMRGRAIKPSREAFDARSRAWYWSNGVALVRPFQIPGLEKHSLWFRLTRNDLGGDLESVLGESRYYEAGVAWLFDTREHTSLFYNFGLGINLNYGSDLRGGTFILLYNFDGVRSALWSN